MASLGHTPLTRMNLVLETTTNTAKFALDCDEKPIPLQGISDKDNLGWAQTAPSMQA